jgi:putative ABC transport system permease protein
LENLIKDARHGARLLIKSPVFTIVAVVSLALGIGANTAIFSTINAFMLAPLPADKPADLVSVFTTDRKNPGPLPTSDLNYRDYRDNNDVFSGLLGYTFTGVRWTRNEESKQLFVEPVSGNYFDVLGIKMAVGRAFRPEEDKGPGSGPVAVLSYGLWQRSFGGSAAVLGTTMSLNRFDFAIVGVADKDFTGTDLGGGPDLWVPMSMHDQVQPGFDWYNERRGLFINMIGRLKPGVNLQQASSSLGSFSHHLEQAYPADNEGRSVRLTPLLQARVDPAGDGQLLLVSGVMMAVVLIVLLIACANVANLLLPRAMARRKEIAIRLAIGANRKRLISQLMVESAMLALAGGVSGLMIAVWSRSLIKSLDLFGAGPNAPNATLDGRVLIFTLGITGISALIFGLAPAIQGTRPDLVDDLKDGVLKTAEGARGITLRKALVVLQVSLSLVSLVGAGLFLRSLKNSQAINPGFITDNVLLLRINLGEQGYTEARGRQFQRELVERMAALPSVQAATIARDAPFGGGLARSVFLEGQEPGPNGRGVLVRTNAVGVGFLSAMGIPLLGGRDFSEQDNETSPKVVVINQTMADRFWPGQDAIGKRFKFFGDQDYRQVVGIARDSKYATLVEKATPFIYQPLKQEYSAAFSLSIRSGMDLKGLTPPVRDAIRSMDSSIPVLALRSLHEIVDQSLAQQRTNVLLLSMFSVLSLLLAAVGLYGVMAYSVAQRTREIGIRMAMGAGSSSVLGMVLKQGLTLVGIGLVLGLGTALIVMRLVTTLIPGISPWDPLTLAATSGLLAATALLANYIPALRATRVSPVIALKY